MEKFWSCIAKYYTSSCWFDMTTLRLGLVDDVVDIFAASSIFICKLCGNGDGPGDGEPPSTGETEFG